MENSFDDYMYYIYNAEQYYKKSNLINLSDWLLDIDCFKQFINGGIIPLNVLYEDIANEDIDPFKLS